MTRVPWWGVVTSAAAPVLLVGGWTLAARLQPSSYDPVRQTVSELAGLGASYRWVMTAALVGTGLCQVATAVALRPAAPAGRLLLAAGGACTLLVGMLPLPAGGGGSVAHQVAAAGAFGALAVWPLAGWRRGPGVPWGLRLAVAGTAGCVLVALTGWFVAELAGGGPHVGFSERLAAAAQTAWPCAVAVSARWV